MRSSSLITALAGSCVTSDLLEALGQVPDPRPGRGRLHPLRFVLAVTVVALATAAFASMTGAAQLAAGLGRGALLGLGHGSIHSPARCGLGLRRPSDASWPVWTCSLRWSRPGPHGSTSTPRTMQHILTESARLQECWLARG